MHYHRIYNMLLTSILYVENNYGALAIVYKADFISLQYMYPTSAHFADEKHKVSGTGI